MNYKKILVTGGAGFIGSFLVDRLVKEKYTVRVFDNLEDQVHHGKVPLYLNKKAEFIKGDVCNYRSFNKALKDVDVVFHLASRVGVAQSNYEIKGYVDTNIVGMANLLNIVVNGKTTVKKVVMTSSMTSYGEGNYKCKKHGIIKPQLRDRNQLNKKDWESRCLYCNDDLIPVATDENSLINNNSIYALTKNVQESLLFLIGKMYKIPVVALRCFNVYGPRQSLSNPYTGVTAIFISKLKNNKPPIIYEDGLQTRDFISVHDVVSALILAMNSRKANFHTINIGSGKPRTIKEIAQILTRILKKNISPKITRQFRINDIRHCFADIKKAKELLGFTPSTSFEEGMKELIQWSDKEVAEDLFENATRQLKTKKLIYEGK